MRRGDFLKALAVLPFAPAVLERLKPELPPWGDTGSIGVHRVVPDGSWVVEFAGATFILDCPGKEIMSGATAPFECRMGVDELDNGWKRLWVARNGMTYSCAVRRGPDDMDWAALGAEGAPTGMINLATPRRIR